MTLVQKLNKYLSDDLTAEMNDASELSLTGTLDIATVPGLWQGRSILTDYSDQALCVNLSGLQRTDSAGVAFLVNLIALFAQQNKHLNFVNLPAQLRDIIRVSGLELLFYNTTVNSHEEP